MFLVRWIFGLACLLIALVFVEQVLGLLFIQRIANNVADPNVEVTTVPFSVRFVGAVAGRLHQQVLDEPLHPDGANWPAAFRWFFVLEMIGLTGIAIAFAQIGLGLLLQRHKWRIEARTILIASILVLVSGILLLKTIPPRRQVVSPPTPVYDVEFMSQTVERPDAVFPIEDLGTPSEQAEVVLPMDTEAAAEADTEVNLP